MRRKHIGETLKEMVNESIGDINTLAIAKIEKVDNDKMMCDIKLLDMPEILGTRDEVATIEDVPIAPVFWGSNCKINAPLSVNDKVIVAFCQHETFFARNSDEPVEPEYNTPFDVNNAIVVGQITKDSENSLHGNDFYIWFSGKEIIINGNGVTINSPKINLNGNVEISGTLNTGGDITTKGDMTAGGKSFLSHTNGGVPID